LTHHIVITALLDKSLQHKVSQYEQSHQFRELRQFPFPSTAVAIPETFIDNACD